MTLRRVTLEEIEKFRKNPTKYDWSNASSTVILSEEIIREFEDWVDWYYISYHQVLSESFIREFQHKVYWHNISYKQVLSENFIREFEDKVDWSVISFYKALSKEFCFEFYDKIYWKSLYNRDRLYKGYFNSAPRHIKLYMVLNYREIYENFK